MSFDIFRHADDTEFHAAGAAVFRAGDTSNERMYVIQDGEIDIVVGDVRRGTLRAGDCFGEIALIDSGPRSASAVARTDCRLVPIDRKRFMFLVQQTPHFALQVMQAMAERLRARDAG